MEQLSNLGIAPYFSEKELPPLDLSFLNNTVQKIINK